MSFRGEARVRQRNVGSPLKRMNALRWLFGAVALSVSLVLTLSPLVLAPTAAAPPEAIQEATKSSDITPDSGTDTERPPEAETPPIRDKKHAAFRWFRGINYFSSSNNCSLAANKSLNRQF